MVNPLSWKPAKPTPLQAAWNRLEKAAEVWQTKRDGLPEGPIISAEGHELAEAALEYAKARWSEKTGAPAKRSGQVVPFGRSKGKAVEDCESRDLKGLRRIIAENVDDLTKQQYRAKNEALLEAIERELANRGEA